MKPLARTSLVCAVVLLGCGASNWAETARRNGLESRPREPDGVVVDPKSELPSTAEAAESDGSLVSLRTPIGARSARKLVTAFFSAMTGDELPAVFSLFTSDALYRSSKGGAPISLSEAYRARAQRFDYRALRHAPVFDEDRIELYRYEDFDVPWELPIARPPGMARDDVALRVPITTTHSSAGRLFGDELVFLVRRDGEALRIAGIVEDFLGW